VDSPNLYQAFGFDGMNVVDPWGMEYNEDGFVVYSQIPAEDRAAISKGAIGSIVGRAKQAWAMAKFSARHGTLATGVLMAFSVHTQVANRIDQAEAHGDSRTRGFGLFLLDQTGLTGGIEAWRQKEFYGGDLSREESFERFGAAMQEGFVEPSTMFLTGGAVGGVAKGAAASGSWLRRSLSFDDFSDAALLKGLGSEFGGGKSKSFDLGLAPKRGGGGRGGNLPHAAVQQSITDTAGGRQEVRVYLGDSGRYRIVDNLDEIGRIHEIGDMRSRGGFRPSSRERGNIEDLRLEVGPDVDILFHDKLGKGPTLINPDLRRDWRPAPRRHRLW
jgi:hypothetical protein